MSVVAEASVGCASDIEALFDAISDTDRLNRESGLPPVDISLPADGTSRRIVRSSLGPLTLEFAEHPWEWKRPERIHVRREYRRGPLTILDVHFRFEPRGPGSLVVCRLEAERKRMMRSVMRIVLRTTVSKIAGAIGRIDRELAGEATPLRQFAVNRGALRRAENELLSLVDGEEEGVARRLIAHVADAPDQEVVRIRPFELAGRWDADRRRALEVCLNGVIAGLLELNWDLICPSCRVAAARVPNLSDLEGHGHCSLCDLSFGITLDQAVEATFLPAPAIRQIRERQFCTGGPAWTPHVVAQANLQPGATVEFTAPADDNRYRLFIRGGASVPIELSEDEPEEREARIESGVDLDKIGVQPGGRIKLTAAVGSEGRHVKLERLEWSSHAATAHVVSTLPAFRRQFSEELLRPGVALSVARVALLFSDLSASTALYAREGDAAAFGLVQDHFDLLRECIEKNHGSIVKTIGDAVMAAFVDDEGAVRAAIEMQRMFPAFRAGHPASDGVYLKIGVYAGPCYAVTANGMLDYFGQTVNIAARLQGQAEDAEIVMTEAAVQAAAEAGLLDGVDCDPAFVPTLKGVDFDIRAIRMRLGDR